MSTKGKGKRIRIGGRTVKAGFNYGTVEEYITKLLRAKHGIGRGSLEFDSDEVDGVCYRVSPTTKKLKPIKPKPRRPQ